MSECQNKCKINTQIIGTKKVTSCQGCLRVWEEQIETKPDTKVIKLPEFPPNNPPYLDLRENTKSQLM